MLQALISFWLLAIQPSNDAIPSIAKGTKYIKPFKIMLGRYPVTIEFKPGLQDNRKITYGIILIALSANWIIILIRSFWHLHKVHSSRRWNCMTFVCKVVSVIMLSFLKPLWELHDWITFTWNFIFQSMERACPVVHDGLQYFTIASAKNWRWFLIAPWISLYNFLV